MVEMNSNTPKSQMDIVDMVGGNGPWQWIIVFLVAVFGIPTAMHNLIMTFYAPNLDHWCARPEGSNWTLDDWRKYGLPPNDQKCSRYDIRSFIDLSKDDNISTLKVIKCESWEYDESLYGSTVSSEFDLVCDRELLVSMSKSIFISGFMFSVLFFGYFADKYGRKPIISLCNIITVVFAVICAFSKTFLMFAICRFFIAVGVAGCYNTGYVLAMEALGPKYRAYFGVTITIGWGVGFAILPLIVWLIKDWFWIQLFITVPSILLLFSWWLFPESPRWLLTKSKEEKALRVLLAAGKKNGLVITDLHDSLRQAISITKGNKVKQSYSETIHVVIKSGMWKKTLIVFYLWFTTSFVYYGLSYNTNELAGDPYINFAVSGVVEILAYAITLLIISSFGRKRPQGVSLGISGISCLFILFVPKEPWWLEVALSMVGKLCIAASFAILYVYTSEIFPTSVRAVSLGSASMSARIGSLIAPFVRELIHATYPFVPQIIFGVLALIGSFLVSFLPETKNVTVPNTFEEAASVKRKEETNQNESVL